MGKGRDFFLGARTRESRPSFLSHFPFPLPCSFPRFFPIGIACFPFHFLSSSVLLFTINI
ncbi:hypothetical protein BDV36DRAFT_250614 [Aspergillus pseudocaelatus]|uniref:Uncharacterized protein n=1 Tax=Aspergillus pseudocaelatus TaxID=1825620 RepID=A0ABQ6WUG6_9EURO|nr:hypothetical protein BDV36DRAFT_250614 [Aspergillus pseudocaelatus]